jgi:hypothetical protein
VAILALINVAAAKLIIKQVPCFVCDKISQNTHLFENDKGAASIYFKLKKAISSQSETTKEVVPWAMLTQRKPHKTEVVSD